MDKHDQMVRELTQVDFDKDGDLSTFGNLYLYLICNYGNEKEKPRLAVSSVWVLGVDRVRVRR